MRKNNALLRYAFMVAFTLLATGVSKADDNSEIIAALDEIDRAIAAQKAQPARSWSSA